MVFQELTAYRALTNQSNFMKQTLRAISKIAASGIKHIA